MRLLNFQNLFELRQVAGAVLRNESHIFQSDAADGWIVKSRFNGDDMALLENIRRGQADAGSFVNFQSEAMSGSMEEALHAALPFAGFIPLLFKELEHAFVNFAPIDRVPHVFKGQFLTTLHCVVKLA